MAGIFPDILILFIQSAAFGSLKECFKQKITRAELSMKASHKVLYIHAHRNSVSLGHKKAITSAHITME